MDTNVQGGLTYRQSNSKLDRPILDLNVILTGQTSNNSTNLRLTYSKLKSNLVSHKGETDKKNPKGLVIVKITQMVLGSTLLFATVKMQKSCHLKGAIDVFSRAF